MFDQLSNENNIDINNNHNFEELDEDNGNVIGNQIMNDLFMSVVNNSDIECNTNDLRDRIVKYCVQDVGNPGVYGNDNRSGIKQYIGSRMLYLVFSCLYHAGKRPFVVDDEALNVNISDFEDIDDACNFSQFIWDFSVYHLCFPKKVDVEKNENCFISLFECYSRRCFNFEKNVQNNQFLGYSL